MVNDSRQAGAGVEITPEMIEAGLRAYDAWYASPESDTGPMSALVIAIYAAMECTRCSREKLQSSIGRGIDIRSL